MADEQPPINSYIVGSDKPAVTPISSPPTSAYLAEPSKAVPVKAAVAATVLANNETKVQAIQLQLPVAVITRADVGRLVREAEAVDNFLRDAAIRQPGTVLQLPKVSKLFDEVVATNKLNLLQEPDRQHLGQFLQQVLVKAPILHISFNTDPSAIFQQRITTWIRQHIHPFVLLQIGLYPSIGAGCVIRTTNKYFDFSLRNRFTQQRELLISKLRGTAEEAQPDAAVKEPIAQ